MESASGLANNLSIVLGFFVNAFTLFEALAYTKQLSLHRCWVGEQSPSVGFVFALAFDEALLSCSVKNCCFAMKCDLRTGGGRDKIAIFSRFMPLSIEAKSTTLIIEADSK